MPVVGGIGALKEADDHIREIVKAVEEELKTKIGSNINAPTLQIEPVGYKTQLVAGTNYFVKLRLDDGQHVHARIYRNLGGETSVHSVTNTKDGGEDISYF